MAGIPPAFFCFVSAVSLVLYGAGTFHEFTNRTLLFLLYFMSASGFAAMLWSLAALFLCILIFLLHKTSVSRLPEPFREAKALVFSPILVVSIGIEGVLGFSLGYAAAFILALTKNS